MVTLSLPLGSVCPRSRAVAEAAHQRLTSDPNLLAQRISCDYFRGVLQLHGRLPTFYQKQIAQEIVKGLDGVEQIVNNIVVED